MKSDWRYMLIVADKYEQQYRSEIKRLCWILEIEPQIIVIALSDFKAKYGIESNTQEFQDKLEKDTEGITSFGRFTRAEMKIVHSIMNGIKTWFEQHPKELA